MDIHKIDQWIRQQESCLLEKLFRLLRQKSNSSQNIGMNACATLLADLMGGSGIRTQQKNPPL